MAGLAAAAWKLDPGPGQWVAVVAVPVAAAAIWALFNVPDDPSRSGAAPIEVNGSLRRAPEMELVILGGGAAAVAVAARPALGMVLALAILGHYLASVDRIEWLVRS